MLLRYSPAGLWYRVLITVAVIAIVAGLSSDKFVNGRHGDFLNNGKVVTDWTIRGKWGTWTLGKANCKPRKYKDGKILYEKKSSCDVECTDNAT